MNTDGEELIADLLDGIVDSLDVPDEMLERTQNLYDDVGEFMRDDLPDDSMWSFRPQGSANLGTIVLPAPGDEFDIDSVATWHVREESITKTDLKSTIGNVLRRYQAAARNPDVPKPTNLDEGRRCWTLEFAEAFHMDVLPSVPDEENPPTGILLTDKTLQNWLFSDPEAYAIWFHAQNQTLLYEGKGVFAKRAQVDISEVPNWQVRTMLQRVVQVLKAHRNCYFADDLDARPASILVTTLATLAFVNAPTLFASVMETAQHLGDHVERDGGRYFVLNPVQEKENFADRWTMADAARFSKWVDALRSNLESALGVRSGLPGVVESFSAAFNKQAVIKSAKRVGADITGTRWRGGLLIGASGVVGAGTGITSRDHTFHA